MCHLSICVNRRLFRRIQSFIVIPLLCSGCGYASITCLWAETKVAHKFCHSPPHSLFPFRGSKTFRFNVKLLMSYKSPVTVPLCCLYVAALPLSLTVRKAFDPFEAACEVKEITESFYGKGAATHDEPQSLCCNTCGRMPCLR